MKFFAALPRRSGPRARSPGEGLFSTASCCVYYLNLSYELVPPKETMDRITRITDLPMIIGEYHAGTVDRGMAQALVQVENQEERGVAYRLYTEQAFDHPGLIGVAYFQWSDQDLTGR